MRRSERQLQGACWECGTEILPGTERAYSFGERGILCLDCALARGGSYDEARDTWVNEPNVDDLGRAWD